METTTKRPKPTVASFEEVFKACGERAATYDRENRFFAEDFEALREAGYLRAPIPEALGGLGLTMDEVVALQRRLGYYATPTAVAINMHLYWMGTLADLWRQGDRTGEWILRAGAAGEVFAAGHAESGNDHPVVWSTTKARRVEGGYRFTGRKFFGSLTPVWTFMGIHGIDESDPENPMIVHGFIRRGDPGIEIRDTWNNVLGMRATQSDDTLLTDAFIPDERLLDVVPAGFNGMGPKIATMFMWFLGGISNAYLGLAERMFAETTTIVSRKQSMAMSRPAMIHHPEVQREIANMYIALEGMRPQIDQVTREWSTGVDHGPAWPLKFISAKLRIMDEAWGIADRAMELAGGFGIFPASGIERMFRDARLGRIHPTNGFLGREMIGKGLLGLDFDEQPRWG